MFTIYPLSHIITMQGIEVQCLRTHRLLDYNLCEIQISLWSMNFWSFLTNPLTEKLFRKDLPQGGLFLCPEVFI